MQKCNDIIGRYYYLCTGKLISIPAYCELESLLKLSLEDMETVDSETGAPFIDIASSIFIVADGVSEARKLYQKFRWPIDNHGQLGTLFAMKLYDNSFLQEYLMTNPLIRAVKKGTTESMQLAKEIYEHRKGWHYKRPIDFDIAMKICEEKGHYSFSNMLREG